MAQGNSVNCDVCRALYNGRCAREEDIIIGGEFVNCDIPLLLQENHQALEFWQLLSKLDRASGFSGIESISSKNIREFCFDYDATWETYEKILCIETAFITKWKAEQNKKDETKKQNKKQNKKPKRR